MWDQDLISPMSLIAEPQFIRSQGVAKMVRLPAPTLTELYPEGQEYIFLVRPTLSVVEKIADAIRYTQPSPDRARVTSPSLMRRCLLSSCDVVSCDIVSSPHVMLYPLLMRCCLLSSCDVVSSPHVMLYPLLMRRCLLSSCDVVSSPYVMLYPLLM